MDAELTTEEAARFAKAYVKLVEAFMREGVPEYEARLEARSTAYLLIFASVEGEPQEPWED